MDRLRGRIAAVTGAGSGIGAAISHRFASEGAHLMCLDINAEAAASTAASIAADGGIAHHLRVDVTQEADCAAAAAETRRRFGLPNLLINAAGVIVVGTATDLSPVSWQKQLDVNLTGPFLMSRAFIPLMSEAGGGSIVMIASIAALQPSRGAVGYTSSKHGLIGLTKALALDHAAQSIRVNAICPGATGTEMIRQIAASMTPPMSYEDYLDMRRSQYPLGRLGLPEDVASAALHFASDESAWSTGSVHTLDGGFTLG